MSDSDFKKSLDDIIERAGRFDDPKARECLLEATNLCENIFAKMQVLTDINRQLNNEVAKLKGEQGCPQFAAAKNISTDEERKDAEATGDESQRIGYKLNPTMINKLKEDGIPRDVLDKLINLKGKYDIKDDFLKEIGSLIGRDNSEKFQKIILKHATYKKRRRSPKLPKIEIHNTVQCPVDKGSLPEDAYRIKDMEKIVQNIIVSPNNTRFIKEVYYSPSNKSTYSGTIDEVYSGEFGPNIIAKIFYLKYVCGTSIHRTLRYMQDSQVYISSSYISDILINSPEIRLFIKERGEIFKAGLRHFSYQQIDDTGCSVDGVNKYVQIICNSLYAVYFTTDHKDRLTILDLLRPEKDRLYLFNEESFGLLKRMNVSEVKIRQLRNATNSEAIIKDKEMDEILMQILPDQSKSKNTRSRMREAGAIANYHQEIDLPVISILTCDDAPQFKLITERVALCWVHDARHYKKISPLSAINQTKIDDFMTRYWEYYRKLIQYKVSPSDDFAENLHVEFNEIFSTETGFDILDERIQKTKAKINELLTVLDFPEVPLHNNLSENGARFEKRYQDISFYTKNEKGTTAKDVMLSIVETCRRLGVNAHDYILDRVARKFEMPSLASLIIERGSDIVD